MTIEAFWEKFLKDTLKNADTKYRGSFHFEATKKAANELLSHTLCGLKKATSSSLYAYEIEGEQLPKAGEFYIVTDWDENPKCVIEITAVQVMTFADITYEICKLEGEDESLQTWRDKHIEVFKEEGNLIGYKFSEEMPIVFEHFKMVYAYEGQY